MRGWETGVREDGEVGGEMEMRTGVGLREWSGEGGREFMLSRFVSFRFVFFLSFPRAL